MEKKYQCVNVVASGHTTVNLSRHSLLQWINDLLGEQIKKVEDLCSGAVYCQLMDMLFPGCVSLKKVKFEVTQTHEYWANFKQLQIAFRAVGCEKDVPIDSLIKGRFQENFEFLQWFKRFFDANEDHSRYTAVTSKQAGAQQSTSRVHSRPNVFQLPSLKETEQKIKSEIEEYEGKTEKVLQEKDFYFNKLRNIEILCTGEDVDDVDKETLVAKILAELYATEEGFEAPEEDIV